MVSDLEKLTQVSELKYAIIYQFYIPLFIVGQD